jgi:hypothetical protein
MPQKIHLLNTKNRPAVGRISILAELGLRPIQAEPVQYLERGMPIQPTSMLALSSVLLAQFLT